MSAIGSIDEVSWIDAYTVGFAPDPVPPYAAVVLRGWCVDEETHLPPSEVNVRIDDDTRWIVARSGLTRPDVAKALGSAVATRAGFEVVIETRGLSAGTHRFTAALVERQNGQHVTFAHVSVVFASADPVLPQLPYDETRTGILGSIDAIVDDTGGRLMLSDGICPVPFGSGITIAGWTCDPSDCATFSEIFTVIDGRRALPAEAGISRPDVADNLGNPSYASCGFHARIPAGTLSRGMRDVSFVARTAHETLLKLPLCIRFVVDDTSIAVVRLEQTTSAGMDEVIRLGDDGLFVRGWAIDEPASALAAGVVILIDGEVAVPAVYGLPRPDVATALGNGMFDRCGFTAEIRTSGLKPGDHTAECLVVANDRRGALATGKSFHFERS